MNPPNGNRATLQRLAHDLRVQGPSEALAISITDTDGQIWHIDTVPSADRLVIHTPVSLPVSSLDATTTDCLLRINAEVHLTGGAWLALHRPSDTVRLFDSISAGDAVPERLSQRLSQLSNVLSQVHKAFRDIVSTGRLRAEPLHRAPVGFSIA